MEQLRGDYPHHIHDLLYGTLPISEEDLKLYQTPQMTRLRQVSLSAVPTWTQSCGTNASRFEHSVGVAHLADIAGKNPAFKDLARDLHFAALAHDLGTPPFSHLSEPFLVRLLGCDHEQFAERTLEGSDFAIEVKRQGGSMTMILDLIRGDRKPFSDIINGTIDIDNLDNTLRYGLISGLVSNKLYDPEVLAKAYDLQEDRIVLNGVSIPDLNRWEECRSKVYQFIYSGENISPGSMIWRGLYFAALNDELPAEFFTMTDSQADVFLTTNCNPRTQILVQQAKQWKHYRQIFNFSTIAPTQSMIEIVKDSWNRGVLADELSTHLKVDAKDVTVHTGKDKGFKRIHLPLVNERGDHHNHQPVSQQRWMAQVYVNPSLSLSPEAVEEFMADKL